MGVELGPWEAVLARALALRPDARFPDAGAFLDALDASVEEAERARAIVPRAMLPQLHGEVTDAPPSESVARWSRGGRARRSPRGVLAWFFGGGVVFLFANMVFVSRDGPRPSFLPRGAITRQPAPTGPIVVPFATAQDHDDRYEDGLLWVNLALGIGTALALGGALWWLLGR